MLDKDTYKRELVRMWDSMRNSHFKGEKTCLGVKCEECPLYQFDDCSLSINLLDIYNIVEKWSKEHQKKYKISRLEYNILSNSINFGTTYSKFSNYKLLMNMLKDGHFEGAKPSDIIVDYINNCEVKENV